MQPVLVIDSRDHFGRPDGGFAHELARTLAGDGAPVTLLMVQNGVLHARRSAPGNGLAHLLAAGVTVLADDFSLRERGIAPDALVAGVRSTPLDIVVDRLVDGARVIWP